MRSVERYKKVEAVREFGIFDFELHIEVHMDFITQVSRLQEGIGNVICIAAGWKCMIAAFVSF